MLEKFFSQQIFARLVNTALALDPAAKEKLSALNGRRISITLEWREQPWVLAIEEGEIVLPENPDDAPCDVRLSGTLAGLLQLFNPPTGAQPPRGKLYIEGDLYAAQQFQRVMGELKPDFETILKQRFGEKLGTRLAAEARRFQEHVQEHGEVVKQALQEKVEDFLKHQAMTRHEQQAFTARLQKLTARLQAVEKTLANMEQR